MASRERKLTEADKRAAAKVRALWADYKKKNPGVSQEKAASQAGMTQSALSQFLLGTVPMRITPVMKLAKLFGVSPASIRDDIGDMPYAMAKSPKELKAQEPSHLSAAALEIARIFDTLQPQTKDQIREQIYILSVIDHSYPWLRRGRPKGESYDQFERRHEQNMAAKVTLEAQRLRKLKT